MLRNTLLGLTAALALGTAALAPSTASASPNFSIQVGGFGPGYGYGYGPFYGYGAGYYDDGPDCYLKEMKVWSSKWQKFVWKTKKVCY